MSKLLEIFDIFEPMNFIKNFSYVGAGMLGIFIVIGILIVMIYILNAITSKSKGEKKRKLKKRLKKAK